MFEAFMLAAVQLAAPAEATPPTVELLEFLAEWTEEEAGLIDEATDVPPEDAEKPGEQR